MCPPVLSRIKSVLSENYFNSQRNTNNGENNTLIDNTQNIETGFYLKLNDESPSLDYEESQRVF